MRIAILGTGNMGRALLSGLLDGDRVVIEAWDSNPAALHNLPSQVSIRSAREWSTRDCPEVVVIATKPQDIAAALSAWNQSPPPAGFDPLWISFAAGVPLARLCACLYPGARICRVMPNTPALIGQGFSAYTPDERCSPHDIEIVEMILSAVGVCMRVEEKNMNAVTGLSGSGPAYVYLFIEALIEAGITAGLPYAVAGKAALQTVIGAAQMVEKTGRSPAELKLEVMSPGGTTVRGLSVLEESAMRSAIIKAVSAAALRAEELGSSQSPKA